MQEFIRSSVVRVSRVCFGDALFYRSKDFALPHRLALVVVPAKALWNVMNLRRKRYRINDEGRQMARDFAFSCLVKRRSTRSKTNKDKMRAVKMFFDHGLPA